MTNTESSRVNAATVLDICADRLDDIGDEGLANALRHSARTLRDPLLLFTMQDSFRYDLDEPWVKDGVRYATDGRIMVAVPAIGQPDTPAEDGSRLRRPNCAGLLQATPLPSEWKPLEWDKTIEADDDMCANCFGFGMTPWHAPVWQAETCEFCDFRPEIRAPARLPSRAIIDGKQFAIAYLGRIKQLTDETIEYGIVNDDVLRFRWSGGEGALMAMAAETSK